jgi:hypothetical protein
MHFDNHLSIRIGHNNLAYGNLFTMPKGGYATRTSGHNYQFLYNLAYGGGSKSTLVLLHGEINQSPMAPIYYAGHNGSYRKNILINFTHFAQVLNTYRSDAIRPPDQNAITQNLWAQSSAPDYADGSGIAPLSWFYENNSVGNPIVLPPANDGRYRSASPFTIDMREVITVPNSIRGPVTVDPGTIPWLNDFRLTN